jgi:hypothetical protein
MSYLAEAMWEPKVIVMINCISNQQVGTILWLHLNLRILIFLV